jgi:hypothetical protein
MMKKSVARGLGIAIVSFASVSAAQETSSVDSALKRIVVPALKMPDPSSAAPEVSVRIGNGGPIEPKIAKAGATGSTTAQAATGAGNAATVDAPKVESIARAGFRGPRGQGRAAAAQRAIVEGLKTSFAGCLTEGDANVEGTAVLNVMIKPTGEVMTIGWVTPGGVSPKALSCVNAVVTNTTFTPSLDASVVQLRVTPRELRALIPPPATEQ